jgi:hypothetical protein
VSQDFCFWFFSVNHFPLAPENYFRVIPNLPPVSMTPKVNFATGTAGVVDTGGKLVKDTTGWR